MVSGGFLTCCRKSMPEILGMLISRYIKSTPGKCFTASTGFETAATRCSESTSLMYSVIPLQASGSSSITMQFIFFMADYLINIHFQFHIELLFSVDDFQTVLFIIQQIQPPLHICKPDSLVFIYS